MKNLIYPLSLIAFAVVLFLIVKYPDSGRMNLIAGSLTVIGFALNIVGYTLAKRRQTSV